MSGDDMESTAGAEPQEGAPLSSFERMDEAFARIDAIRARRRGALRVRRLTSTARLPERGSAGAIGYDLYADIGAAFPIPRMARRAIPLGIALAIPQGHYGRIAPRSGLALRDGAHVMGGVIDPDYRGEVKVILVNLGDDCLEIVPGQRIAQLILEKASVLDVIEATELDETARGAGGFGGTGS